MSNIITSEKILEDAYNNAFLALEKNDFRKAEALFKFVTEYTKNYDEVMVDYGYIIIYTNTRRVDMAIELCKKLLANPNTVGELRTVVEEIKNQLEPVAPNPARNVQNISNEEIQEREQSSGLKTEQLMDVLEVFELVHDEIIELGLTKNQLKNIAKCFEEDSRISAITSMFFSDDSIEMQKHYAEDFFQIHEIFLSAETFQTMYSNFEKKFVQNKEKIDPQRLADLTFYFENFRDELLFYLILHKRGLLSKMLINEHLPNTTISFILYKYYQLYDLKVIGNLSLQFKTNANTQANDKIGTMISFFEEKVSGQFSDKLYEIYQPFAKKITEDVIIEMMECFNDLCERTFPYVLWNNEEELLRFTCAIGYYVSELAFGQNLDEEIEMMFKLDREQIKKEIRFVDMMISLIEY
ncbi:MAG: hypothetical protein ACRCUP_00625 [Mycoplasmatales bacterium]